MEKYEQVKHFNNVAELNAALNAFTEDNVKKPQFNLSTSKVDSIGDVMARFSFCVYQPCMEDDANTAKLRAKMLKGLIQNPYQHFYMNLYKKTRENITSATKNIYAELPNYLRREADALIEKKVNESVAQDMRDIASVVKDEVNDDAILQALYTKKISAVYTMQNNVEEN